MTEGRLSAKRYNRIVEQGVTRWEKTKDRLVDEAMVDKYPPFTAPLDPLGRYNKLVAMRNAGDPNYTKDPAAIAELNQLSIRFGQPQALSAAEPFGTRTIAKPYAELGAALTAQKVGPPAIFGGV